MGEDKEDFRVGDVVKIVSVTNGIYDYEMNMYGKYHGTRATYLEHIKYKTDQPHKVKMYDRREYVCNAITHDTSIQVGDRIRVTGTNVETENSRQTIGQIGTVIRIDGSPGYEYFVTTPANKYGIYSTGIKVSNDTPLSNDNNKEDNMDKEQVTRDGYVYTKLKSLSPESVLKGGPRKEEFENYISECQEGFYGDQSLEYVVDMGIEIYGSWLPWLISHGYIGKEEVRKEVTKTYQIGFFKDYGRAIPFMMNNKGGVYYENKNPLMKLVGKENITMTLTWEE